jgi:hypothetical protein
MSLSLRLLSEVQFAGSVRAHARLAPKNFQILPRPADPVRSVPTLDRQTQKSPTNPRGFFGLPSQRQTNFTGGSANDHD